MSETKKTMNEIQRTAAALQLITELKSMNLEWESELNVLKLVVEACFPNLWITRKP